jgi:hypothetical protein
MVLPRGAGDGMQLWECSGNGVCNVLFKGTARSIGEKSDK